MIETLKELKGTSIEVSIQPAHKNINKRYFSPPYHSCIPACPWIKSNNNHKMWWFLLLKGGDLNSYFQYFLLHRGNSMSITYWIFSVSSFICLPGRRSKFPKRWIDSHASRDGCLASHPFTLPHLFNLSEKSRCSLLQHTLLKNIFIYLSAASLLQAHRIFDLLCEMWGF